MPTNFKSLSHNDLSALTKFYLYLYLMVTNGKWVHELLNSLQPQEIDIHKRQQYLKTSEKGKKSCYRNHIQRKNKSMY